MRCHGLLGVGTAVVVAATVLLLMLAQRRDRSVSDNSDSGGSPSARLSAPLPQGAGVVAGALDLADYPCILEIDYTQMSVTPVRRPGPAASAAPNEVPTSSAACTLYLVVDPLRVFVPLARAALPDYVVLQSASSLPYALRHVFSIMSTNAYASLHSYRHFVYIHPDKDSAVAKESWLRYLAPKRNGTAAVLQLFATHQGCSEHAVLFVDFDGWFNLRRSPAYSLEALAARVHEARRLATPASPAAAAAATADVDVLLQGEPNLCSCCFIVYDTPFGRQFWAAIEDECRVPVVVKGKNELVCSYSVWEQYGYFRVIFKNLNGTSGVAIPTAACQGGDLNCQFDVLPGLGAAALANIAWPHFGFVPQTGQVDAPQLHGCMFWNGCAPFNEAIWYHTGSTNFQTVRIPVERDFRHHVQDLMRGGHRDAPAAH